MAKTANEQVLDALVRHQIHLLQLDVATRNEVLRILNDSEKELAKALRDGLLSIGVGVTPRKLQRTEALLRTVEALRKSTWNDVGKYLRTEFTALVLAQPDFISSVYRTAAPVQLDFLLPAPTLLESLVTARPFAGKDLSGWMDGLRTADIERIKSAVRMGMLQGETVDTIVRRVIGAAALNGSNGVTQTARRDARTLVRTAINSYTNMANRLFFVANSDVFSKERFVATLDGRTTQICISLDGRLYPVGVGPIPPLHYGCRSVRVAFFDNEALTTRPYKAATERGLVRQYAAENGFGNITQRSRLPYGHKGAFDAWASGQVRSLVGQVPRNVPYTEWLRGQSVQFQNDVLGITRARLFRKGNISVDRFVARDGDPLTLGQIAERNRAAFIKAGLDPDAF